MLNLEGEKTCNNMFERHVALYS